MAGRGPLVAGPLVAGPGPRVAGGGARCVQCPRAPHRVVRAAPPEPLADASALARALQRRRAPDGVCLGVSMREDPFLNRAREPMIGLRRRVARKKPDGARGWARIFACGSRGSGRIARPLLGTLRSGFGSVRRRRSRGPGDRVPPPARVARHSARRAALFNSPRPIMCVAWVITCRVFTFAQPTAPRSSLRAPDHTRVVSRTVRGRLCAANAVPRKISRRVRGSSTYLGSPRATARDGRKRQWPTSLCTRTAQQLRVDRHGGAPP